ncbi:MAG: putative DNA modification/repair radical SAM protein, partial [Actinobacteria bacterium]|nr:putative DNA modification/repair radical SAM protein [Actinomycetota bacterium]
FVSSGVIRNPDYTMERMSEAVAILRNEYGFNGYIHAKAIPGASEELIERLGFLVDRMSINIELPSQQSLMLLAPDKSKASVIEPMATIAGGITQNKEERALSRRQKDRFVPAGQSTQLIVGATPESDFQILRLSNSLYRKFELKRVFFSAYLPVNSNELLPDASVEIPLAREHRLYQADWLMRFYRFDVSEIISEANPFLDVLLDPKANWALNHLDLFPVEINSAPYEMLLRIPGLGVNGAQRVQRARRNQSLRPDNLKKMGLSLKRMQYFITCNGEYASALPFNRETIYRKLAVSANPAGKARRGGGKQPLSGQLSFMDTDPLDQTGAAIGVPQLQAGQVRAFEAQRKKLARLALPQGRAS